MHLCQIECAKPFTREAAPTDHDYATIFDSIQPGIVPMGLTSVLRFVITYNHYIL